MSEDQAVLKEGDAAPEFSLPSSEGREVRLGDFRGKSRVVLYFYPKDDTPGCTKEACGFRDMASDFESQEAVVLGMSLDDEDSHRKFIKKYALPFTLLSDRDAEVCKAYGVYKLKNMYGKSFWGIERTTFVIDKEGRIAKIYPRVKVDHHIQEVLECLKTTS